MPNLFELKSHKMHQIVLIGGSLIYFLKFIFFIFLSCLLYHIRCKFITSRGTRHAARPKKFALREFVHEISG